MSPLTKRTRTALLVFLCCVAIAGVVWAFVSASVNISKENGFVGFEANPGDVNVSKWPVA